MRKLKKSELKRVYGAGHGGAGQGSGSKNSDAAGDAHTFGAGDSADVVTTGTD